VTTPADLPFERAASSERPRQLRRVVIEEDQRRKLEHARAVAGFDEDADPHAHDQATFRLISERRHLDTLDGAEVVVPLIDQWKYWAKMNDWDSRNRVLQDLIAKFRRRETSEAELTFLIVVCRPTWRAVARKLHNYGGVETDANADGRTQQNAARRAIDLDRQELDQVVQSALLNAFENCPRPFPGRFFLWLKETLAWRALEHVQADLRERGQADDQIGAVLDDVLQERPTNMRGTRG
jgi:hypothetical protein